VRAAREVAWRECASAGRPMDLRLWSRLLGRAFQGPLVSIWRAFRSPARVLTSGWANEDFQERMGNSECCREG